MSESYIGLEHSKVRWMPLKRQCKNIDWNKEVATAPNKKPKGIIHGDAPEGTFKRCTPLTQKKLSDFEEDVKDQASTTTSALEQWGIDGYVPRQALCTIA